MINKISTNCAELSIHLLFVSLYSSILSIGYLFFNACTRAVQSSTAVNSNGSTKENGNTNLAYRSYLHWCTPLLPAILIALAAWPLLGGLAAAHSIWEIGMSSTVAVALHAILTLLPGTFTIGEGIVVVQAS